MRQSALTPALLGSLVLHILGLTVGGVCWHAWHAAPPPRLIDTELITVSPTLAVAEPVAVPVAVPEPPPSRAAAVPRPPSVSLPPALPPALPPSVPPPPTALRPPPQPVERDVKRVEPQLLPAPKPTPVKPRAPAPRRPAETKKAPGPPLPLPQDASAGTRGNVPGLASAPQADTPPPPAAGAEAGAGKLFDRGDVGVIPGAESAGGGGGSGRAGLGTGGEAGSSPRSGLQPGSGGTGERVDSPARPLAGGYQVKPTYPDTARRQRIEGTTLLKVHVNERGEVTEVLVEQSAGHRDLDQAAVEAVKQWRFTPARTGNQPIAVWVRLPVRFELK